jgi:hypothetical protein
MMWDGGLLENWQTKFMYKGISGKFSTTGKKL